ncbi:phosphotransferase [Kribbella sp. NPDC023855]|uniref:phosphotransferase n=1 Tax=Kribbella sp. NPDC023855 TaxID=3154698 RepID=UPI003407E24A
MLDATHLRALGPITTVEPVQGFVGNQNFRLRTDAGETFYYKSGAASALSAEVWACRRAREVGVPAPEIVSSGDSHLIQRALTGSPSSEPEVLEQAGAQLRRLHEVTGDGYGFLHEGLRNNWLDVLNEPFDLGRFSRDGATTTDALLRGYGLNRTPATEWTLTFYRTIWSVMALHWEHAAGGDWFTPHLATITTELPVLELS